MSRESYEPVNRISVFYQDLKLDPMQGSTCETRGHRIRPVTLEEFHNVIDEILDPHGTGSRYFAIAMNS